MRRCVCWLGLALVVAALAGCGVGPLGDPEEPPPLLPPDQRVFAYDLGDNGWTGQFLRTMSNPVLVVYGDGRVFQVAENQSPGLPTAYTVARVDPATVARFAVDAEQRNVVSKDVDFGDLGPTDQATATVVLHGAGGETVARVYAFDQRFEDGLRREQRRARATLREVIDAAYALPGDANRVPYVPDQVRVVELRYSAGGNGPGAPWPGPDPAGFLKPSSEPYLGLACGTLSGADAERAYAAARNNPDGIWTVDGRPRVLAVVPRLPGVPGCPD